MILSEAYRDLKINLQYLLNQNRAKSIAIVSADCSEGKSTICTNLSVSFSKNNKKVLLIDFNLREPGLHKLFNMENNLGVSDILLGNALIDEVIQKYDENIYILTAGKVMNETFEILEETVTTELLENLKNMFDLIIIDTVKINNFTDTTILASKVDGVIIVARVELTKKASIVKVKEKLTKAGANILGIILNGVGIKDYSL